MNEHIIVVSGADPIPDPVVATIDDQAIVLAVDGGLDHALAAGLSPSGLIGDLDSVSADGLAWATEHATIARHRSDKNETDTELALSFAADMTPNRITLIGGGDRLDHTLAAIGSLGRPCLTGVPRLDGWWDGWHLDVIHGPGSATLALEPGSTMSVLALHGPCRGVAVSGTQWELDDADLAATIGLGLSNVVDNDPERRGQVDVRVSTGVLTIVDVPRADEHDPAPATATAGATTSQGSTQ